MLDQIYGRPSSNWKRSQVFLVLLFWISRIRLGNRHGPRSIPILRRLNLYLTRFTPWQIVVSTLTLVYAIKNSDAILGLQAPEPLARLYSREYYRATWIVTALDAGFATAMTIRWKKLRDIASLAFSLYYLIFPNEADEKLRRYRAVCTVEMLRATWEKTSNPYIRFATQRDRPQVGVRRKILLPRPAGSSYDKPIVAWVLFNGTDEELAEQTELIFDVPGGGFICMDPTHHEERTLRWTIRTGKPVLGLDYGKAPEYPFPYAIDETYDVYKVLHESKGKCIGMKGTKLGIVMTGDSAGANIATAMVVKILETRPRLPLPVSLVFAYAALSFHFTSWMPSSDVKVLRQQSSGNIADLLRGKDHLDRKSPLSVVEDVERPRPRRRRSAASLWARRLSGTSPARLLGAGRGMSKGDEGDDEDDDGDNAEVEAKDKSLSDRVVFWNDEAKQAELQAKAESLGKEVIENAHKAPIQTRLAMTSRTAFFNDRIISPSMCRAMALLYIGPNNTPDMHSDYHISPIFTPANLLAQFPPVYLSCGERDPFVDDTVIFAGKVREAKEARKLELLARENRHGESLRMSGSSAPRDPLLDQDEDDWAKMQILGGWSHGYLQVWARLPLGRTPNRHSSDVEFAQMIALLPGAEEAVNMLADSITESFEKQRAREAGHPIPSPALAATAAPLTRRQTPPVLASTPAPTHYSPPPIPQLEGMTSESDRDDQDNVLSFTPRKTRSTSSSNPRSRSDSPAFGSPSRNPDGCTVRVPAPRSGLASSSDETVSSLPRTPGDHPASGLSPPVIIESTGDDEQGRATGVKRASLPMPAKMMAGKTNPSLLIDAKDLLKRRREEAVYGILSTTNSNVPSDDESSPRSASRQ
ncbi:BZ3500_MvSof-1268-A1-R1_Chr2-1g04434 [Microbotryum saponariae]|uniref:BZ3500_MvSof-1268-A1-R1_Chr2-1g04434 protein n=1 Tax=Microbotryum saponariae TaxID=289078 RepID=A0A2X0MBG1_9BASI|nr:BZ3500_MvSof-1268-A1-R1_Chr2-1g04434 [Microbotryum saponariae]SCZ91692.1 BZ3501_MvSof-1269-A2-R1_Chr2-1g04090 [Microbotryum saponariae]